VSSALFTIGVYGFDAESFLRELRRAQVRVLVDVRQRRGVRGSQYAWANARRLEVAVVTAGIAYRHHREVAPTTELRQLQYAEDARLGVGKRSRQVLAPEYLRRYTAEILERVDLSLVASVVSGGGLAALLCVETEPHACHRSVLALRLGALTGLAVEHLGPGSNHR
jgi:uncharacterized protein (DUF488 family)